MFERMWNIIKTFLTTHEQHAWLEYHLLYFFLFGLVIALVLGIIWLIRIIKDIKKLDKEEIKRERKLLKLLLGKRKNKTF
jgi:hypothetical protein